MFLDQFFTLFFFILFFFTQVNVYLTLVFTSVFNPQFLFLQKHKEALDCINIQTFKIYPTHSIPIKLDYSLFKRRSFIFYTTALLSFLSFLHFFPHTFILHHFALQVLLAWPLHKGNYKLCQQKIHGRSRYYQQNQPKIPRKRSQHQRSTTYVQNVFVVRDQSTLGQIHPTINHFEARIITWFCQARQKKTSQLQQLKKQAQTLNN
eukprot:TRINITY_DN45400_c2_g1_i1.p1 TRINITY_DN45400_c2_g1~~TRINITY_DN45400_c2_g1_i1.p1  ORF type:complete len:206 (+),score=-6.85 TRINITY_DN45400_c2_g1_i1:2-619(+)